MTRAVELRQAIEDEAKRLGFHLFGVCAPMQPPHLGVFMRWLQAERQAEMEYLASPASKERRADPGKILPGCRSILVLGMHYPAPLPARSEKPAQLTGRIAAYAWGEDYHDLFLRRMQKLDAFIQVQVGDALQSRSYTDTGAILERDFAQLAGLGWIGKNTCLIHPRQGSFLLLAEILLTLDLPPDKPFTQDHCGSCTRCIEACPTGCIMPDRTLDSRRCISYLTIENKGPIPQDLRPLTGDWIFGCDICQQVCPWNQRFAREYDGAAFNPRPENRAPDLLQELSLSQQEFSQKFKGSPIKRAKRRGYLRNVTVALGNLGSPEAVPALAQALCADPEPLVRGHAAWALGRIGGSQAAQALEGALSQEQDVSVAVEIRQALDAVHMPVSRKD